MKSHASPGKFLFAQGTEDRKCHLSLDSDDTAFDVQVPMSNAAEMLENLLRVLMVDREELYALTLRQADLITQLQAGQQDAVKAQKVKFGGDNYKGNGWFSFDGETFETHATEEEAAAAADSAMQYWRENADIGWDELSTQVAYGKITHAVRVETEPVTDETQHTVPAGCDTIEHHFLERIVPAEYRCNICGGIVEFDGTPPVKGNWGSGK